MPSSWDLGSCDLARDLTRDPPTLSLRSKQILSYYYQNSSSLTYRPNNKTSIKSINLKVRRGYHQSVDQRSETFTNIAIILIHIIYK